MLLIGVLVPIEARFIAGEHCGSSSVTSTHRPDSGQLLLRVSLRGLPDADSKRAHREALR
jgi:hypothetical protein